MGQQTATMTGCECRWKRMLFGTQGSGVVPSHAHKVTQDLGSSSVHPAPAHTAGTAPLGWGAAALQP